MNDKEKVVRRLLNNWDCKRHKSDVPCKECYDESDVEYYRAQAEQEEYDREQEWLHSQGP